MICPTCNVEMSRVAYYLTTPSLPGKQKPRLVGYGHVCGKCGKIIHEELKETEK